MTQLPPIKLLAMMGLSPTQQQTMSTVTNKTKIHVVMVINETLSHDATARN